jgi:hypothetical protein
MKRIICAALLCLFLHSNMVVSAQESCHWVEPIVNVTGPVVVRLFHLEPNPIVIGEKVEVVLMLYNWLPESVVAEYVIEVLDHARNSIGVVTRQKVQVGGREVRSILHSRIPTEGAETFEGFLAVQVRGGWTAYATTTPSSLSSSRRRHRRCHECLRSSISSSE